MKPLPDHDVRERVRTDFGTTLVLEAGAGTGKTTVLVDRLVNLVLSGAATLDRVVAITFTEAAAGELKMRLRDGLEAKLAEATLEQADRLSRAVVDLERAHVSTIHAFASALLRERPFEAGVDPSFQVVADVAGERTFDDVWNRWIEERLTAGDEALLRAVHLGLDIGAFRDSARSAVAERDVLGLPVTRVPFDPASFLGDLEATLGPLKKHKKFCVDEDDGAYQSILELEERVREAKRLSGSALEVFLRRLRINASRGRQSSWQPKSACGDVKGILRELKEKHEAWVEASDADVNAILRECVRDFLERYEEAKSAAALADFQDLLLKARDVLATSPAVRRYFQAKFDFILVDEFQDTDPLQAELVCLLAADEVLASAPESASPRPKPQDPRPLDWRSVNLAPGKLFIVGDPKQSIYRFRRADLQVYEAVKALVLRCGGDVLPLTTNFRTVPSIIGFVNERFTQVFAQPGDPEPIPLQAHRDEVGPKAARAIALTVPPERLPADETMGARREVVAETIAAFIDHVTRVKPWSIWDPALKATRPARPGDVAILVRKMTPEFIAPYEEHLRARGVSYRLVGGKEYFARDEVRALGAVLRAIDNPADRLSLVQALRSPFFAVSDADLLRFVGSGGILNINAPQKDDVQARDVFDPAFTLLARLHRLRRIDSPSVIVEELFGRTRALAAFLLKPSGTQMVANLWKVLETARAYEAAAPATLRAFVRFLQDEEASSRAEGDSPVGESIGASVEIVTVHKAKGLEYPIVIVADLFTDKTPQGDCIIDHAGKQGWLKIGKFRPEGWADRQAAEQAQEEAEGRRLLYVALTRARDHLVVPCLPGVPVKSWLGPIANELVRDASKIPFGKAEGHVTWFDSRRLVFGVQGPTMPASSTSVQGSAADARAALAAEEAWQTKRRSVRKQAKQVAVPVVTPSAGVPAPLAAEADDAAAPSAQRLFGAEAEGDRTELSAPEAATGADDQEPATIGSYVHEILATVDLSGADLQPVAATLARKHGIPDGSRARAIQMVERVLRLPLMDDARAATRLFREVPLTAGTGGGVAGARADLLFEHGGQWRAVEFKTDRLPDGEARPDHLGQLAAYASALSRAVGAPVRGAVCFAIHGEVLEA